MSIASKIPAFISKWGGSQTCGHIEYFGTIPTDSWEKRKGISKEQTENQKALEQDFYQTGCGE